MRSPLSAFVSWVERKRVSGSSVAIVGLFLNIFHNHDLAFVIDHLRTGAIRAFRAETVLFALGFAARERSGLVARIRGAHHSSATVPACDALILTARDLVEPSRSAQTRVLK